MRLINNVGSPVPLASMDAEGGNEEAKLSEELEADADVSKAVEAEVELVREGRARCLRARVERGTELDADLNDGLASDIEDDEVASFEIIVFVGFQSPGLMWASCIANRKGK